MIKAVIFDCFGVLTTEGWLSFKAKYFKNDLQKMQRATMLNRQLDSGSVDYTDTVQMIADLAEVSFGEVDNMLKNVSPNRALLKYIGTNLKPQYRIGLLSNVAGNWLDSFFQTDDIKLFDIITLSYESGILKPDPEAYRAVAERLLVAPEECVFVDDREGNMRGAQAAGMQAILYQDFEQMKAELERMLAANTES